MADGRTGYMHRTVVSEQPLNVAAAASSEAPAPAAQLQAANGADDGRGLEMVSDAGTANAAPANNAADVQALGQVASAAQSGNLGQVVSGLGSLFGNSQGANTQQTAAPQVQFQPINQTVTVRKGALIRATPVYNAAAVARASLDTKVQATGRTANNLWWEVLLPNGQPGYVEGRMIGR
jgi:hypothetical protein